MIDEVNWKDLHGIGRNGNSDRRLLEKTCYVESDIMMINSYKEYLSSFKLRKA